MIFHGLRSRVTLFASFEEGVPLSLAWFEEGVILSVVWFKHIYLITQHIHTYITQASQ